MLLKLFVFTFFIHHYNFLSPNAVRFFWDSPYLNGCYEQHVVYISSVDIVRAEHSYLAVPYLYLVSDK